MTHHYNSVLLLTRVCNFRFNVALPVGVFGMLGRLCARRRSTVAWVPPFLPRRVRRQVGYSNHSSDPRVPNVQPTVVTYARDVMCSQPSFRTRRMCWCCCWQYRGGLHQNKAAAGENAGGCGVGGVMQSREMYSSTNPF